MRPDANRTLVLVKHALPVQDPDVPASRWTLSDEGRGRCVALADHLARFGPSTVHTSAEPKAAETARLVARRLGVNTRVQEGLEEHHRDDAPFFHDPDDFDEAVRCLFTAPDELVYGSETANEALARFEQALLFAVEQEPGSDTVVVTHGTVITLFLARHASVDPMETWRLLGLPSCAVLALPGFILLDIVPDIT